MLCLVECNQSSCCGTYVIAEEEDISAVSNCEVDSSRAKSSTAVQSQPQPPRKKSRLLGGVDINSPHVQKLIHAKSAHTSLVDEVL